MWMLQRNLHNSLTESGLGAVRSPTLILWGERDAFDAPWQATELGPRIHGVTARVLPGCGHNVHEDCPVESAQELVSFFVE